MKILQVVEPGRSVILDVPVPEPGPGQVLVRIEAVTTCPQWDLHLRHNEPMFVGHQFIYPYEVGQPGHEATGTIEALGVGVVDLVVGDRVSAWRDAGHDRPGCYAQYVVHEADNVILVPSHLPPESTASLELAMCVGTVFQMLKGMGVLEGSRMGITGLGPAGLVAAQYAAAEGASEVVGFDLSPARRERGLEVGLDSAWDPRDVLPQFPARPSRPAFTCGVDCVGARASVEFLMDRVQDTVALFGVQREDYVYATRHYDGLRLCGYKGHSRSAARYAVEHLERGALDLTKLVTHHFPLEQYDEAVTLLEKQEAVKVCFWPWR